MPRDVEFRDPLGATGSSEALESPSPTPPPSAVQEGGGPNPVPRKLRPLWLTRHHPPPVRHTGPSSGKGAPGYPPGPRLGFRALGWGPLPHRGSLWPDGPSRWPGGGCPPSPCLQDLHPQVPALRCPWGCMVWRAGAGRTHDGWSPVKPTLQQGLGAHWTQCSHLHGPRPWTPAPLYRGQRKLLGTPGRRRDGALSRGRVSPCRPSGHAPPGQQGRTSPGTSCSDPRAHPATRCPLGRGASWPVLRLSARSAGRPGPLWVTLLFTPPPAPRAWPEHGLPTAPSPRSAPAQPTVPHASHPCPFRAPVSSPVKGRRGREDPTSTPNAVLEGTAAPFLGPGYVVMTCLGPRSWGRGQDRDPAGVAPSQHFSP